MQLQGRKDTSVIPACSETYGSGWRSLAYSVQCWNPAIVPQALLGLFQKSPPLPGALPFQVELEVLEDSSAGQEGTAEAGQDLPAVKVAHTARMGHLIGLLDELAVQLVPQRPQVMPRLQDALDDGDGVGHGLQLLQ